MMWKRSPNKSPKQVNERRRTLIKFGLIGGATFVLGKVFGPSINLFSGTLGFGGKEYDFKNFRVVENGEELGFYDKLGNEILILEKNATQ